MAIAFVQYEDHYAGSGSTGTVATDNAINTTSGNFLVVIVNGYSGNSDAEVASIADTAGNTYTKAIGYFRIADNERVEIWYAKDITGNANNITTATYTGITGYRYISVAEFSGMDIDSPLDDTDSGNSQTGTSHTSGNATASINNTVIIGAYVAISTGNLTVGSGYTTLSLDLSSVLNGAEYKILSSTGEYAATFSTSGSESSGMICAIFKGIYVPPSGTNMQINVGDAWKEVPAMKINVGDAWKEVASAQINVGDAWKSIF